MGHKITIKRVQYSTFKTEYAVQTIKPKKYDNEKPFCFN